MNTPQRYIPILKPLAAAFAIAIVSSLCPHTLADDIRVANRNQLNITVIDLRDGALQFRNAQGVESLASLPQIQRFTSPTQPNLAAAFNALERSDDQQAINLFRQINQSATQPYIKAITAAQLIQLHDKAGRTQQALPFFIQLAQLSPGLSLEPLIPSNLPADTDARTKLADTVAQAIAQSDSAATRVLLRQLETTLRADPKAAEPAAQGEAETNTSATTPEIPDDPIQRLLDAGNYEIALRRIEDTIATGGSSLSRLLFQRGTAHAALEHHEEAAIAFMRVIIHYRPDNTRYYLPALIEAGRAFRQLNQNNHARTLWTEARALTANDEQNAAEIDRLIATLPPLTPATQP